MKTILPVRIKLQWVGTVNDGRQLELLAVHEAGTPFSDHCYPLITLFKDKQNEELHVELYTEKGTVQISAKDFKNALNLAEEETHSEQWYEDNVYPKIDTEQASGGNGSKAICRVSNVLRSPSPDPGRSAKNQSHSPNSE